MGSDLFLYFGLRYRLGPSLLAPADCVGERPTLPELRQMLADPWVRDAFLRALRYVGRCDLVRAPDRDTLARLAAFALSDGRLVLTREPDPLRGRAVVTASSGESSVAEPVAGPEPTVRHWVEIALVDEEGGAVKGMTFELELPNGRVVHGRTDDEGLARVAGLESTADCVLRLPKLDRDLWAPA